MSSSFKGRWKQGTLACQVGGPSGVWCEACVERRAPHGDSAAQGGGFKASETKGTHTPGREPQTIRPSPPCRPHGLRSSSVVPRCAKAASW